jgi:hypothetical protein
VRALNLRGLNERGTLIAANDAALYTQPHHALSKCPRWVAHRAPMLRTLGVPHWWLGESTRRALEHSKTTPAPGQTLHWFEECWDEQGATFEPGVLSGENSGHAAVNLALTMAQPGDTIYLLGMDLEHAPDGAEYWYPPYPWPRTEPQRDPRKFEGWRLYMHWLAPFAAQRGVNVATVGHGRNLPDFPAFSDLAGIR